MEGREEDEGIMRGGVRGRLRERRRGGVKIMGSVRAEGEGIGEGKGLGKE